MCTFQGENWIREQLNSIKNQTYSNYSLWISDDGSTDNTLNIIHECINDWGKLKEKVHIIKGPRSGFVQNFLSLACHNKLYADYYAFSDQDDIWLDKKLEYATGALSDSRNNPAFYFARSELIDSSGNTIGSSPTYPKSPSFRNALVENIATGNTIVINDAARTILKTTSDQIDIPSHDWWIYLLVTAIGGNIFFDTRLVIKYRQHHMNCIGARHGVINKLKSAKTFFDYRFNEFSAKNSSALLKIYPLVHKKNKSILLNFKKGISFPGIKGAYFFFRSGVYRMSWLDTFFMRLYFLLRKGKVDMENK